MDKRPTRNQLLVNAVHASEEIRFALVYNNHLENLYIDKPGSQKKGNIYKAKVIRLEPSLQAAFVDYGAERHGFLPFKEIAEAVYCDKARTKNTNDLTILDVLEEGQELLIQVDKEERGSKGAALTTQITLAGSYLVLMPNNPRAGGISRRIEGDDRDELRDILQSLQAPDKMGLIVRTAGVGKSQAELQWDLDILLRLWNAICNAFNEQTSPCLIHQESDIISRAIRDYLRKDITEIVIDNLEVFNKCKEYISQIRPEFIDSLVHYTDHTPLFTRYHVESQIETAFQSYVRLPSGGSLVIQQTEALVSIDVNSSRDTKGGSIEQTAFNTNREAAVEIARQLRLRDLGGLIVADFIDMVETDHQREIVQTFQDEVQIDKARVQFGRISKFGLLEISRQRLRPSLSEYTQIICPRCEGLGNIRSVESLSFLILRLMTEHAMNNVIGEINVQVPNNVAAYLCNEKRRSLEALETEHQVRVYIIPNPHYQLPQYKIEVVRKAQMSMGNEHPSYNKVKTPDAEIEFPRASDIAIDTPAVSMMPPERPADLDAKPRSLIKRLSQLLFGIEETETTVKPDITKQRPKAKRPQQQQSKRNQSVKRPRSRNNNQVEQNCQDTTNKQERASTRNASEKNERKDNRQQGRNKSQKRSNQNKTNHQSRPSKNCYDNDTADYPPPPQTIEDDSSVAKTSAPPTAAALPVEKKKPSIKPEQSPNLSDKVVSQSNVVVDKSTRQSKPKPQDFEITVDTGSGTAETVIYDPKADDIEIVLGSTGEVSSDDQSAAIAKHRKQKAKQYAKKQSQQKRRRRPTTATNEVSEHQEAKADTKATEVVFVVDSETSQVTE